MNDIKAYKVFTPRGAAEVICALGNWKNHGLFVPLAI